MTPRQYKPRHQRFTPWRALVLFSVTMFWITAFGLLVLFGAVLVIAFGEAHP